jgi:hypothetical protein
MIGDEREANDHLIDEFDRGLYSRQLYLLDASEGAVGPGAQLQELAATLRANRVLIVDGGADVLTTGREAGLRSPLGDSLVLAAAAGLDRQVQVLVAGLGWTASCARTCCCIDAPSSAEPWRAA